MQVVHPPYCNLWLDHCLRQQSSWRKGKGCAVYEPGWHIVIDPLVRSTAYGLGLLQLFQEEYTTLNHALVRTYKPSGAKSSVLDPAHISSCVLYV